MTNLAQLQANTRKFITAADAVMALPPMDDRMIALARLIGRLEKDLLLSYDREDTR